jgi:citrate lyase subunit beta/citryl-CoA lyase
MPQLKINPSIARTWLLVNATQPQRFATASKSEADQVVLDLEDSVAPSKKSSARETVSRWLSHTQNRAWVRINDRSTDFWSEDIRMLGGLPGVQGVMLAKTESASQLSDTSERLGHGIPIIALLESARGIENAVSIAETSGCFRLAFGSGDYRRDTGTSADDLAMAYPRSKLVLASRIGDLPGPIDGPTVGTMKTRLREHTEASVSLGLTGKLLLDPSDAVTINSVLGPSPTDISWADSFLSELADRGNEMRDGSDLPLMKQAEKIKSMAAAFGLNQ